MLIHLIGLILCIFISNHRDSDEFMSEIAMSRPENGTS